MSPSRHQDCFTSNVSSLIPTRYLCSHVVELEEVRCSESPQRTHGERLLPTFLATEDRQEHNDSQHVIVASNIRIRILGCLSCRFSFSSPQRAFSRFRTFSTFSAQRGRRPALVCRRNIIASVFGYIVSCFSPTFQCCRRCLMIEVSRAALSVTVRRCCPCISSAPVSIFFLVPSLRPSSPSATPPHRLQRSTTSFHRFYFLS